MLQVRNHVVSFGHAKPLSDCTNSSYAAIAAVMDEWVSLKRRGKIIIHCDGRGPAKVEFDYYIDL